MIRRSLALLCALSAASPAAADAGLRALQQAEARVAAVHWRLVTANAARCEDTSLQSGLMLHTLTQYAPAMRALARTTFGLDARPGVYAVVPGSPAARAGLMPGDALLALDSAPLAPVDSDGPFGMADVERIETALAVALADGEAHLKVERAGVAQQVAITASVACAPVVSVLPERKLQAWASDDHRTLFISTAMVRAVAGNDELAFVLAHELAHTIRRDAWTLLPKREQLAAARSAEEGADRMGVALAAAAGYDPMAAARLVARLNTRIDPPKIGRRTHQRWQDRVRLLTAIAAPLRPARPPRETPAQ